MMKTRIKLLSLLCLCSVGYARATPRHNSLPYTEKQFEMAVACIKHFEGWHTVKNYPYVGYGHQLQKGERYSARTLTKKQGDLLLRLDLMRNIYLFRGYGKDALLLSVLAYNVGPYAILGTSKRPKSRLLRKIERGDRNIYNDYIAFCRWHGRQVKSIKFRRQIEFDLFFSL
ncbi:MAG: lysozyme [Prevotella sp.]|nr:lysozyme [Bacteroidaceae bacterium]MBQ5496186.1 lysozyme [Prevotella sp.]